MKKGGKKEKNDTMVTRKKCLIDVAIVGTICFFLGMYVCGMLFSMAAPKLYKQQVERERREAEAALDYKIQELKYLQGLTPVKNQSQNKSASHSKHTVYDITPETMLAEVNKIRAEHGVAPLQLNPALNKSAQEKCSDMVANSYYNHQNPNTGQQGYELAMRSLGVNGYYGENLALDTGSKEEGRPGYITDKTVFDGWMKSTPHAKAIVDSKYTLTGFGKCTTDETLGDNGHWFFVEHFYSPTS